MSLSDMVETSAEGGFPRVGGDEPENAEKARLFDEFSSRERGWALQRHGGHSPRGVFPA